MGKYVNDDAMDALLDYIASSTKMSVCSGQPTNFSTANALAGAGGYRLSEIIALSAGHFVKANGTTNGRKVTVSAFNGKTVSASGNGDHVALFTSAGGTSLRLVTTFTLQAMTAGNTINIGSFKDEVADPS